MFGTPGEDLFSSWVSLVFLIGLAVVGLFVFKVISDVVETHLRNNKGTRDNVNNIIDKTYGLPKPLKLVFKVLGTVVYLAVCLIIIAYAGS
jgi:hypothetical protein